MLAALPATFPAPILVVLHIGAHHSELPALLSSVGALHAKHAENGELILPGNVYVAPPDRHMMVSEGRLSLNRGPKENWARPAIDPLFRSAAAAYGPKVVGVILTGGLNDGTLGLFDIKQAGGIAIVQDPDDAAYPDMPRSALENVAVDHCVPLAQIPNLLIDLISGKDRRETAMPITPSYANGEFTPEAENARPFDRPVTITCPDCGGALYRSEVGSVVKFGCHIGHTYTSEVMATAQFDEMEKVLRSAVRYLNERAEFCRQMAENAETEHPALASDWHAASQQALDRSYKMRDLVEEDWIDPGELAKSRATLTPVL